MSVLSRNLLKFLDRLFFDAAALEEAVAELRQAKRADAENSSDPTGKEAVADLSAVPRAMGYEDPEAWLRVVELTWARYHSESCIGKVMRRRYLLQESPEDISYSEHIATGTYWKWRVEFLTYAVMIALRNGINIKI